VFQQPKQLKSSRGCAKEKFKGDGGERVMKSLLKTAIFAGALAVFAVPAFSQTAAPAGAPVVNQRQENQQDRIAQGVKSGQLTAGETANLETREAAIHHEVKTDRAANGGKLTPAERRQVTRQQNRTSKAIYRKKHNGRVQ
jgi:hypothetical protein